MCIINKSLINVYFWLCLQNSGAMTAGLLKVHWDLESRAVGAPVSGPQPLSRRNSTPLQSRASTTSTSSGSVASSPEAIPSHRRLDRCHSEPVDRNLLAACKLAGQQQQQPGSVNTSRYKTELCRPYEESGACKYGDKCQFAHGGHELRSLARHPKYKTELCRTFHTIGFCPYGPRCHFIHNAEEARIRGAIMPSTPQVQPGGNMMFMSSRPKPLALGGSAFSLHGSTGESPSPPCSLSESPTSSLGSFFSEPDLLFPSTPFTPRTPASSAFSFGPEFVAPLLQLGGLGPASTTPTPVVELAPLPELEVPGSPASSASPSPPPSPLDNVRLPVFNQLSRNLMA
jgi:hypothetical protein